LPVTLFFIAWVVIVIAGLSKFIMQRRRESPTRKLVHGQTVIFATNAAVLINGGGARGSSWRVLQGAGWPELLVHPTGLEVTIGAFDGLVTGNTMLIDGATMCRDRLGAFPLMAGSHDCIRIWGTDGTSSHEWKVSPRGTSTDEVWAQLAKAGVAQAA
jgi:hypothetical protein